MPRWLQVTIRFLKIDGEGGEGGERTASLERREEETVKKKSLSTRFSVRFRGVSARYTSFNRIRMQCCGKFHLSKAARGSTSRDEVGQREGGGGQARESGSRCDFVSTLRTPSRVPPLAVSPRHLHIHRALSQMQSRQRASARHDDRISLRR